MQPIFDCLIDSYLENQVGLTEHFLSISLAAALKQNLLTLYSDQHLQPAGMGNNALFQQDNKWRGDKIYWLDLAHNDPNENEFFKRIDAFVQYLNSTCYTGITGYEFHYTMYEKGAFYKRHLDQFRDNKSRAYSMIMYLNTDWEAADGGELQVYHTDHMQSISPNSGKCVFFKSSELEHEVMVTQVPRLSITGWLKCS